MVIDTIKPDGTGDYTTLQAWWDDTRSDTEAHWAECYAGGDLGSVFLTEADFAGTSAIDNYWKIYTPLSQRHNGRLNSGAYAEGQISTDMPYSVIDGLRVKAENQSCIYCNHSNWNIIKNNLCVYTAGFVIQPGIFVRNAGLDEIAQNYYIFNNIVYTDMDTGDSGQGIRVTTSVTLGDTTPVTNAYVWNNTIVGNFNYGVLRVEELGAKVTGNPYVNMVCENNICGGDPLYANYQMSTDYSNGSLSINNNLSSDDTADDWGGTGHIINTTITSVIVDALRDFRLQTGSAAISAGKTQTYFTDDFRGLERPFGATNWDMGAFEFGPLFKEQLNYKTDITRDIDYKTNVTQAKGFKSDITEDIDHESLLTTAKAYKSNITQEINYKSELNG